VQATDINSFFDSITGVDRLGAPRLRELLTVAAEVSTVLVMLLKHELAVWRPAQRSARVQPVINTPGHGSLPSGHATQAALNAVLLGELMYVHDDERRTALDRLARRIAFNRVVAGVHFPMDSLAGHRFGTQLALAIAALARGAPMPAAQSLQLTEKDDLPELEAKPAPRAGAAASAAPAARRAAAPKTLLGELWRAAGREVRQRRV
jgi:hypothetical protein